MEQYRDYIRSEKWRSHHRTWLKRAKWRCMANPMQIVGDPPGSHGYHSYHIHHTHYWDGVRPGLWWMLAIHVPLTLLDILRKQNPVERLMRLTGIRTSPGRILDAFISALWAIARGRSPMHSLYKIVSLGYQGNELFGWDIVVLSPEMHSYVHEGLGGNKHASKQKSPYPNKKQRLFHLWCRVNWIRKAVIEYKRQGC